MDDRPFAEVQKEFAKRWKRQPKQRENYAEIGRAVLEFALGSERLRYGVTEPGAKRDARDRRTINTLRSPEGLGPSLSRDEVVFRRLVEDPATAIRYLEQSISEISQQQSERASKPRPKTRDSITNLIGEILEDSPHLSAKEVGARLKADCDITLLDGEYRHEADASTLKEVNLPSRVSDAKKRLGIKKSG